MALAGRGSYYTWWRHATEETLALLYGDGWPARLAERLALLSPLAELHHQVHLPRWPWGLGPLRLAYGSDFHSGPTTTTRQLEQACAALQRAQPQVLLLGGDYVFLHGRYIDPLAELFAAIPAPLGRFAVMGNHDLWADDRYIAARLERAGVQVLVNQSRRLAPPYDFVSICGLDEPWSGRPDARAMFQEAGDDVRVVLMHAPSGLLPLRGHRFDVALCGHTHGGQIALPGGIPIVIPGPLSRRYPHGRHQLESGAALLVSRGIGGVEVPVRWNADPDILVCDCGV